MTTFNTALKDYYILRQLFNMYVPVQLKLPRITLKEITPQNPEHTNTLGYYHTLRKELAINLLLADQVNTDITTTILHELLHAQFRTLFNNDYQINEVSKIILSSINSNHPEFATATYSFYEQVKNNSVYLPQEYYEETLVRFISEYYTQFNNDPKFIEYTFMVMTHYSPNI